MLFCLILLTFIAGVIMHALVLHYPTWLYRQWGKECSTYLQEKKIPITPIIENDLQHTPHFQKISWQYYLPFFWMFIITPHPPVGTFSPQGEKDLRSKNILEYRLCILVLDIILFASSLIIFYHSESYLLCATGLLFTWLLITSSFIDAEHQLLPDELTYILLWAGLVTSCWDIYTYSMSAILGVFVAYSSLWVISFLFKFCRKKEGIGHGDLKLLAAITAWTGLLQIPLILFFASIICLFFIFLRRIFLGREYSAPIAFGPFLAFSGWFVLLWGQKIAYYLHF